MKYPPSIPKQLPPHVVRKHEGDCPQHRAWIRQQGCIVVTANCAGQMHAHHVRNAANAGTGIKPTDATCVPLCALHHDILHRQGQKTFEGEYAINLATEAEKLAQRSPALRKMRQS